MGYSRQGVAIYPTLTLLEMRGPIEVRSLGPPFLPSDPAPLLYRGVCRAPAVTPLGFHWEEFIEKHRVGTDCDASPTLWLVEFFPLEPWVGGI